MIHRVDERLREEARRYRLVFACPDCAQFAPEGDHPSEGRCSLGYPHEAHCSEHLDGRTEVVFCKAFELR